ncbi:hypothetical protein PR048_008367 [Dryococelus australis]|uniref:Dynein heavy chain linker domain-containing protein n=1 Tax=Dryococelus australis TaxID=614101 RepID=A0ABQ9HWW6_9NEOP|nr:hypothetical protein PR048_008367 [Dryococelus australis]
MRVIEVSIEQHRNARAREIGDLRENLLISGIVQTNPHMQKPGATPWGIEHRPLNGSKCFGHTLLLSHVTKENIRMKIEEFKEHLPIVKTLGNPGMKERHWEKVSEIVGFPIKPGPDLTLAKRHNATDGVHRGKPAVIGNARHVSHLRKLNIDPAGNRIQIDLLDYSPLTKVNRVRFLGEVSPGIWESCRKISLVSGFSRDPPSSSQALHFGAAPYSSHFTLIGSQDLDVGSRLYLTIVSTTFLILLRAALRAGLVSVCLLRTAGVSLLVGILANEACRRVLCAQVIDFGLDEFIARFEAISDSASKENSLEHALRAMQTEWAAMKFLVGEYRDSGTHVVAAVDDIQSLLDDHIVSTQTMKNSPYIKPFHNDIV